MVTTSHILFDADGVLQHIPGGWVAALEPYLGDRTDVFLRETWRDEVPTLAGDGDYLPMLAATLAKYGVAVPVDQVYRDVWHRIELIESSIALVHALRTAGYGVHLATNQEKHRGEYMRSALGYDSVFEVICYSYELGLAKPDPEFFREAVRRIGTAASTVLFIDDSQSNVAGARTAGLAAEQWHFDDGEDALLAHLARHGVEVPPA